MDLTWKQLDRISAELIGMPEPFFNLFHTLSSNSQLELAVACIEGISEYESPSVVGNFIFEFIYANHPVWFYMLRTTEATDFVLTKLPDMSDDDLATFIFRLIPRVFDTYSKHICTIIDVLARRNDGALDHICDKISQLTEQRFLSDDRNVYFNAIDVLDFLVHPRVGPFFMRHFGTSFLELLAIPTHRLALYSYEDHESVVDFIIVLAKTKNYTIKSRHYPDKLISIPDMLIRARRYSLLQVILQKDPSLCLCKNGDATTIRKYVFDIELPIPLRSFLLETSDTDADLNYILRSRTQLGNELAIGTHFDLTNADLTLLQGDMRNVYYSVMDMLSGNLASMFTRGFGDNFMFPFCNATSIFDNSRLADVVELIRTAKRIIWVRDPFFLCDKAQAKDTIAFGIRELIIEYLPTHVNVSNAKAFLNVAQPWWTQYTTARESKIRARESNLYPFCAKKIRSSD